MKRKDRIYYTWCRILDALYERSYMSGEPIMRDELKAAEISLATQERIERTIDSQE